jgi:hypothetical protein
MSIRVLLADVVAVEVATHDYWRPIEPFRVALNRLASLPDVTLLIAAFDSTCPDRKQEKVDRTAYPEGNNPFVVWFSKIKNPPRLGDQNSEAFLWVLSKPATFELIASG